MSDSKIKLAVGVANMGSIKSLTAFALCRALKNFPHDYKLIFKEGSILHANREQIVKTAIEQKCTHLLFLDADMYFEEDAILRLLKRDKEIVGTHSNTRRFPTESTVILKGDVRYNPSAGKKGCITCDSVGTGFVLIKLDVFKKLSHPWFFWESDEEGNPVIGEDYWFCRKAREVGFKVWVDLTIPMGHIGDNIF